MKSVWMIYPDKALQCADNAFSWFREEASRVGLSLDILSMESFVVIANPLHILYKDKPITLPDTIVIRGYDYILSSAFETLGIKVINSTLSMQLSRNKMLTHYWLEKAGIPSPRTLYGRNIAYATAVNIFKSNSFIVKDIIGSKGEQVWMVNSDKEYQDLLDKYSSEQLMLQEYIKCSDGRDIRVWVIGGKAIACVERYSETDFRSNFAQGGKVKEYPLTDEIKRLSEAASNCLGMEFAGVDLLFTDDKDKFTICEVNGNAGFRTISKIGGENIPHLFFEFILQRS